ncbi:hypothetical protein Q4575_04755 [Psychrosphaera sp. 1_MG-2023]|uniref:hypothetical protein n=1 Tax=Psychrosphaera sp. 1_MG-2023 TaxID=3062643 RepID=UPI0026E21850|nr:hypothetical protein [Psychrosphaera sp. 1_MG-2023]MDO6718697.1 hypothetical protein [Psychrosphaera sp. 1_MG-2023]
MSKYLSNELPDFPEWFESHLSEQLCSVSFESTSDSMISYIKLWGLIEIFTKIIVKLYEKRCHIKELEPLRRDICKAQAELKVYSESLENFISQYQQSISYNEAINLSEDIAKVSISLKRLSVNKFSTKAKDIAPQPLPNQEDFERASNYLGLETELIGKLLKPKGKQSKYYDTRNLIAHEGKIDIKPDNLFNLRIQPIKTAVEQIRTIVTEPM